VAPTVRPTATPVPRSVVIPEAFRGTWTSDMNGTSASSGTWTLRITEHDAELRNPIAGSGAEFFSLNPDAATTDRLELAADPDCPAGHYAWAIEDGRLTFATTADVCEDRLAVLTTGPWSRQP
jgi:hypothetical protein